MAGLIMYFNDAGNGDHLNFDSELLLSYEAANFIIMNRFFNIFPLLYTVRRFIVHSVTIIVHPYHLRTFMEQHYFNVIKN